MSVAWFLYGTTVGLGFVRFLALNLNLLWTFIGYLHSQVHGFVLLSFFLDHACRSTSVRGYNIYGFCKVKLKYVIRFISFN